MTVKEVIGRVAHIKNVRGDDEVAHSAEDNLHQDVLRAITEGARNSRKLAEEALKTLDIGFARWRA